VPVLGLYYAGPNKWAATAEQAHQFTSVSQAARFGLDNGLPDLELTQACHTLPDEIAMPLLPGWCAFDPPGPASNWIPNHRDDT
jgi:hypothetical protein